MPAQDLARDVGAFITEYNRVFNALSGLSPGGARPRAGELAALYHTPCVTVRADGSVICLQSPPELERFFQTVADTHYEDGYRSSHCADLEVVPLGTRSVLASVTWSLLRADGSLLKQWRQSYTLIRDAPRWRILASVFHIH
ncbi:MAG: hypothetical protein AB7V27_10135 [Candidatus Binatia bacterium]